MQPLRVTLTDEQRRELERSIGRTHDVRVYRRLKVVELSSRGYTVQALAAIFGLHQQSIRNYLHAYAQRGIAALPDSPRPGRPRKLPPEYDGGPESRAAWQRLLDRRPSTILELATPSDVWTLGLLRRYMWLFHHVDVAESTIYNALARAQLRRGRSRGRIH